MHRSHSCREEETRLVERCQEKDAEAQTDLWHRFHEGILQAIRRFLSRLRASADLDEDIAATFWSDLFYLKPWRLRAYRSACGCLEVYLKSIGRLTVLDFLAKERLHRLITRPLDDLDQMAPEAERTEVQETLEHLLAHLSKGEQVLLLSYLREDAESGPEAVQAAACLRQRKKRLIHKALRILGLRHKVEKSGKNGTTPVTNRPRNLG